MHNKPAIAPRSVREAFGPYARLEQQRELRFKRQGAIYNVVGALLSFAAAVVLGVAFGWLMTLWPRLAS